MALLTPQIITSFSLSPAYQAVEAAGDTFANSLNRSQGVLFVSIKNQSGGAITATAEITQTVEGQSVVPLALDIPSGEEILAGPFDKTAYGTTVKIVCSVETGVTIALLQV